MYCNGCYENTDFSLVGYNGKAPVWKCDICGKTVGAGHLKKFVEERIFTFEEIEYE